MIGLVGAPALNPEFESLRRQLAVLAHRLDALEGRLSTIEADFPAALSAVTATSTSMRMIRRQLHDLATTVEGEAPDAPLASPVGHSSWHLAERSKVVGGAQGAQRIEAAALRDAFEPDVEPFERVDPEVEIANPDALSRAGLLRLSIGTATHGVEGYVNVDTEPRDGADVIAPLHALPFEEGSVVEILTEHPFERHTTEELEHRLLPHWFALLTPGGRLRSILVDVDLAAGQPSGSPTAAPDRLAVILERVGFEGLELVAVAGHLEGLPEFELVAVRPL